MNQIINNEVNAFESFKNTFGTIFSKERIKEEIRKDYHNYETIYNAVINKLIINQYFN
jgi:hypothetical protein